MTRPSAMLLALLMALPLLAAHADDAPDAPGQPAMRVICLGDAMAPELLRFAFQSEPAGRIQPEVIRTASAPRRNHATAPRAQRQAARPPQAPPTLRLPCISG